MLLANLKKIIILIIGEGDRMNHHNYSEFYSKILQPFLDKEIYLIEVGILTGIGLAIWCDIFNKANIIGYDIDIGNYIKNKEHLKSLGAFKI